MPWFFHAFIFLGQVHGFSGEWEPSEQIYYKIQMTPEFMSGALKSNKQTKF